MKLYGFKSSKPLFRFKDVIESYLQFSHKIIYWGKICFYAVCQVLYPLLRIYAHFRQFGFTKPLLDNQLKMLIMFEGKVCKKIIYNRPKYFQMGIKTSLLKII